MIWYSNLRKGKWQDTRHHLFYIAVFLCLMYSTKNCINIININKIRLKAWSYLLWSILFQCCHCDKCFCLNLQGMNCHRFSTAKHWTLSSTVATKSRCLHDFYWLLVLIFWCIFYSLYLILLFIVSSHITCIPASVLLKLLVEYS